MAARPREAPPRLGVAGLIEAPVWPFGEPQCFLLQFSQRAGSIQSSWLVNHKNSFNFITQAVNETLNIVKRVWMFSISFEFIYQPYELLDILRNRTSLPDLEQTTEKEFVFVACKA